jgi:hypothetical protein
VLVTIDQGRLVRDSNQVAIPLAKVARAQHLAQKQLHLIVRRYFPMPYWALFKLLTLFEVN